MHDPHRAAIAALAAESEPPPTPRPGSPRDVRDLWERAGRAEDARAYFHALAGVPPEMAERLDALIAADLDDVEAAIVRSVVADAESRGLECPSAILRTMAGGRQVLYSFRRHAPGGLHLARMAVAVDHLIPATA